MPPAGLYRPPEDDCGYEQGAHDDARAGPSTLPAQADEGGAEDGDEADEYGRGTGTGTGRKGSQSKRGHAGDKVGKDGNPKKKRKQLVACDSCRLRRVKCDKAEMAGGACTECSRKSITCTDTYVKNKPKVVRGGKLIAQAKLLYGDNATPGPSGSTAAVTPGDHDGESSDEVRRASLSAPPIDHSPRRPDPRQYSSYLPQDLSEHLVRHFFDVFQPQCPLVDTPQFIRAWEAAGRVVENLSPANEVLALVIQAWAARLTDHPHVVGQGAPSLQDLRGGEGRDFTAVGNRRDEFARQALQRALDAVDRRGALRLASAAGCAALTLLEFLVDWSDADRRSTCGRYLLLAASEHLRNLQLDLCDDPSEPLVRPEQVSNGTLLWVLYTRDAIAAMFSGRFCSLTDDDLSTFSALLTGSLTADVLVYISSDDPNLLSGLAVAAIFRYCNAIIRDTVTRLTGPLARRNRLTEQTMREIWSQVDESARYALIFRSSVQRASFSANSPNTDVWFRDLIAMRSQHTLGIHRSLAARLRDEEHKAATQSEGDPEYLDLLRRLKAQADERLFRVAQEYTALLHGYRGSLLFSATVTAEHSSYFLAQLVEMPAWEQGGPSDYPWARKLEEVTHCIDVMKIAGWAWTGYDAHIEGARQSLARQGSQLRPATNPPTALLPPISTAYHPPIVSTHFPHNKFVGVAHQPPQPRPSGLPDLAPVGGAGLTVPLPMHGHHRLAPGPQGVYTPISPAAPLTPQSLPGLAPPLSASQTPATFLPSPLSSSSELRQTLAGPQQQSYAPDGVAQPHQQLPDARRHLLPAISAYRGGVADGHSPASSASSTHPNGP
ncbi:uncharacterized protein JCM10292_001966 [Rhodotorula paludigena]|uniref:uncharacterized protein n=1 Tax=Rhodotorula paludigena TaxID=86838 RepID=UPI003182624B